MYNGNTEKFRYEKKVFGRIKGEIQVLIGHNPDLLRASDFIKIESISTPQITVKIILE